MLATACTCPRTCGVGLALGLGLGLVGPACSGSTDATGIEAGTTGSHARVRVELAVEGPRTLLTASARFLRYREVDPAIADVLAGGPGAPTEVGECELSSADDRLGESLALLPERGLMSRAAVIDLDAGEVAIWIDGVAAGALQPVLAPAMAPYVAGVEYDELALTVGELGVPEVADGAAIVVSGLGGDDVGAFEGSLALPPAPTGIAATLEDGLRLRWTAPPPYARGTVRVLVQRGFGEVALSCAAPDSGAFTIDAATLAALPGFRPGEDLLVALERTDEAPLIAPGVQAGVLEAAVRYVVIASAP